MAQKDRHYHYYDFINYIVAVSFIGKVRHPRLVSWCIQYTSAREHFAM